MITEWLHGVFSAAAAWNGEAILLRLLLATMVGTVIGLDREYRNKGAGIKTHVLVCLGSAMTMIVSQYVAVTHPEFNADVNRIGSQVVSGVGFLGVGTIIVTRRNEVRGLTTAAGLWACACIGLAAGIGFVEAALVAMVFVVVTFVVLSKLDGWLRKNSRIFDLYIELEDRSGVKELLKKLHSWDCECSDFALTKDIAGSRGCAVTVTVKLEHMGRKGAFIDSIDMLDFVSFCDEL